jgi:ketosteroid isomerase-like protein
MIQKMLALLIGCSLGAAVASASDNADILALITRWNDLSNQGDEQGMADTCANEATVIDDLPPYEWQGPGACSSWQKAADAFTKSQEMTDIVGGLGKPTHVMVASDRAYVVIPATFAYTQHGKRLTEYATATFTLQKKAGSSWLITSWSWSKRVIRPAGD